MSGVSAQARTPHLDSARRGARLPRPPRALFPSGVEREYGKALVGFVRIMCEVARAQVEESLPTLVHEERTRLTRSGIRLDQQFLDVGGLIESIRRSVERRLSPQEVETYVRIHARKGDRWNWEQVARQLKSVLGLNPHLHMTDAERREVERFVKRNVQLCTTIREDLLSKLETMVIGSVEHGTRAGDLSNDILRRFKGDFADLGDQARRRAQLIARDQIAKYNGALTQMRQRQVGVSRYVWRTCGDERVRPSHRALDGKVVSWNKPPKVAPGRYCHPGEDYQCRCIAEPIFDKGVVDDDPTLVRLLNSRSF